METSFDTLKIDSRLIKGLQAQAITCPTPVQALTYPKFCSSQNLIVESHTGSGKTLAYLLPLFEKIDATLKGNQAIILAPTHELSIQINEQIKKLSQNSGLSITSALIMGEVNIQNQINKLKTKPQIIVGSPGRILDLVMKKKITIKTVQTFILDEADNLLESSQGSTVKKLLHQLEPDTQIALFSASISKEVKKIAAPFLKDPHFIHTSEKTELSPTLEHFYIKIALKEKFEVLKKLILATKTQRCLVFVNQHTDTPLLIEKLTYHNLKVSNLSGKCSKEERKLALENFKSGKTNVLISSDVSARGLDVKGISHVFHYDIPLTAEDYLHRSGRSGRNGNKGTSIALLTSKDLGLLGILSRTFKINVTEIAVINGKIKNLATGKWIDSESLPMLKEATPSKKKNKYPKGYTTEPKQDKVKHPKKKALPVEEDTSLSGTLSDALKLISDFDN